jgi:hypothetical protein
MAIRADHARLIVLCERLADATLAGATEWRGEGDDHYLWEREEGTVSIGARDRDGQPPYELAVFNSGGEKVEELASALVDDDRPAEWNEPLAELYRVARRSALHADEIIDALLNALPARGVGAAAEEEVVPAATTSR